MTANSSRYSLPTLQGLTQEVPEISFKQCAVKDIDTTYLEHNDTIDGFGEVFTEMSTKKKAWFFTMMLGMKLGTTVAHFNRGIALSAPRRWRTVLLKYILIPQIASDMIHHSNRDRYIKKLEKGLQEDSKADKIFRPIWYHRYKNQYKIWKEYKEKQLQQPFPDRLNWLPFKFQEVIKNMPQKKSDLAV